MRKLKRQSQFQRVYKKGKLYRDNNIALSLFENGLNHNRIGISVDSKKVPLSVNRNRCKRLILETYRLSTGQVKPGYDIILITKRDISRCGQSDIREEVLKLYKKAAILR